MTDNIIVVNNLAEHLLPAFRDLNEFNIIYTDNQLQNDLLDEVAPNFFWELNKMYFDKFFLSISRMLDPSKQGNFENLSLNQLIEIAKQTNYSNIIELQNSIQQIKTDSSDILTLRSKFIAHRDLDHSVNQDLITNPIEFEKLKDILWCMASCINKIQIHLGIEPTSFMWFRDLFGASALLKCLRHAMIYRDALINREDTSLEYEEAKNSKYGELNL